MRRRQGVDRSTLARDVYSILHFPLVFGVVLVAVALEEAVAHPDQALPVAGSLALAGGVVLFVASTVAALRGSGYRLAGGRLLLLSVVAAGVWAAHGAPVTWSLLVVVVGLLLLGAAKRPAPSPSW